MITLQSKLSECLKLNHKQILALKKIGLETVENLLWYIPVRYGDVSSAKMISDAKDSETTTFFGKIDKIETGKTFKGKVPVAKAKFFDETGSLNLIWFNQAYIAKMFPEGSLVRIEGVVKEKNGYKSIANPKIEIISKIPEIRGESLFGEKGTEHFLYPIYKETKGITSNWIIHTVQKLFSLGALETIEDKIPSNILKTYNLPSLKTALVWIHTPKSEENALIARKRFAFEEIFFIQIQKHIEKEVNKSLKSTIITNSKETINDFTKRLPFSLTKSQEIAINDILKDFKSGHPMARLLHGDVGSGKTIVAATTAYAVTQNHPDGKDFGNFQIAYMAPTEILARQHFESFKELFSHLPVSIGLLTGSICEKFPSKIDPEKSTHISKTQLKNWVKNGEISILIGTHALIQKSIVFKNLAYVIIDEQHRFGTEQRKKLARKDGVVPHLLSMSATPIPRTLALTVYGDLDLSTLEQPENRKKIDTEIVLPNHRQKVYAFLKEELKNGRQAYVICPRIDEPDPEKEKALNVRSVKEEAKRLKKEELKDFKIDLVHSKMKPKEKENVMERFYNHEFDILVSTSVVEVGVNVPNATIIIIEGGERFGLSQLHQLRGRVMRGSHKPYCFIFAETKSDKTYKRLNAFLKAKDGFELAELDLSLRGSGELSGGSQWGITDIGMEALKNIKMVEYARKEAREIVEKDLELKNFPLIKEKIESQKQIHFE